MHLTHSILKLGRQLAAEEGSISLQEIDALRTVFDAYDVSRPQLALLTVAWSMIHDPESEQSYLLSRQLLTKTFGEIYAVANAQVLVALFDKGIMMPLDDTGDWLLHKRVRFAIDFEVNLERAEVTDHMPPVKIYATEDDVIDAYIGVGKKFSSDPAFHLSGQRQITSMLQVMAQQRRSPQFPFTAYLQEKGATVIERLAVCHLAHADVIHNLTTLDDLMLRLQTYDIDGQDEDVLNLEQHLVDKGLARSLKDLQFRMYSSPIVLSDELRSLMRLDDPKRGGSVGAPRAAGGQFTVFTPTQGLADLIVDQPTTQLLRLGIERFQRNINRMLAQWGVQLPGYTLHTNDRLIMLFYGPPGTGKTMAAYAMAKELQRDVVTIDGSSFLTSYVGESEKRLRDIFVHLQYEQAKGTASPVVVINEADAILHQRIQAEQSADHMRNNLVAILLEELERYHGLMILTVNDVHRMDEAFSRRIDMKINLGRPDAVMRRRLWELYLPPTIPGVEEIDREQLARNHELTGGQIRMVVANACVEAVLRPTEEARLRHEDLERYITLERCGQFERKISTPIGFV